MVRKWEKKETRGGERRSRQNFGAFGSRKRESSRLETMTAGNSNIPINLYIIDYGRHTETYDRNISTRCGIPEEKRRKQREVKRRHETRPTGAGNQNVLTKTECEEKKVRERTEKGVKERTLC